MKLLVTTDGSERSLRVLPHAALFARSLGAEIVLSRVLDPRQDLASDRSTRVRDAVTNVSAQWKAELEGLMTAREIAGTVHIAVREGATDIGDMVVATANEVGAALIAMDTRGRGALRQALFGSVAMSVLKNANVPVMVTGDRVGEPAERATPYHLVVTDDGSPGAAQTVQDLASILIPGRVRVTLLNVYEQGATGPGRHESAEAARAYLETLRTHVPAGVQSAVHVEEVTRLGGIDTAITEFAMREGANAIASATHGHSARRQLIAGSTALGAVRQSPIPVILERSAK